MVGTGSVTTTQWLDAISTAQQRFDELDIPKMDRCLVLTPALYWELYRDEEIVHMDRSPGNGSIGAGTMGMIAGLPYVVTNHLPSGNVAAESGQINDYSVDATDVKALLIQKEAVGKIDVWGVHTEDEYSVGRQSSLVVSTMAFGSGVLRPECAIAFTNPAV